MVKKQMMLALSILSGRVKWYTLSRNKNSLLMLGYSESYIDTVLNHKAHAPNKYDIKRMAEEILLEALCDE